MIGNDIYKLRWNKKLNDENMNSKKGLTKRGLRYEATPDEFIKDCDASSLKEGDRLCQNLPAFIRKENGIEKGLAIVQPACYILDKTSETFDIRLLEFTNVISKAEGTQILSKVVKAERKRERKLEQIRFTGSISEQVKTRRGRGAQAH